MANEWNCRADKTVVANVFGSTPGGFGGRDAYIRYISVSTMFEDDEDLPLASPLLGDLVDLKLLVK